MKTFKTASALFNLVNCSVAVCPVAWNFEAEGASCVVFRAHSAVLLILKITYLAGAAAEHKG